MWLWHGVKGEGVSREIPALARNGAVLAQGPENVLRVVLGGLPASHGLSPMPAVGVGMSDAQVANTVNYIRNAFGNAAPGSAEAGLVAKIRAETRSALAGNPQGGCAPVSDPGVSAQLEHMNESNMLQVIDRMLPKLRAAESKGKGARAGVTAPEGSGDALVNRLTEAYCAVLAKQSIPQRPAARSWVISPYWFTDSSGSIGVAEEKGRVEEQGVSPGESHPAGESSQHLDETNSDRLPRTLFRKPSSSTKSFARRARLSSNVPPALCSGRRWPPACRWASHFLPCHC